jgi:STAS domain
VGGRSSRNGSGGRRCLNSLRRTRCEASGLSALIRIADRAGKAGCRHGLIAVQLQVVRVLRITGLDQRLPVFSSVDDAAAHLMPAANAPAALTTVVAASALQELQLSGPGDRLVAGGDAQLAVDRERLRLDGVGGQEHLRGDLRERQAGPDPHDEYG